MTKYAIVVETRRCIGCSSCSVACKLENNLPDQVWYSRVETIGGEAPNTPAGEYGNNTLDYVVVQCNHCDMPLCARLLDGRDVQGRRDGPRFAGCRKVHRLPGVHHRVSL